jgi:Ca2+-binding RTX toxin-like protein
MAGWALSADEKSAMYTAAVTDKALATFTFATTDTITHKLADKVLTLSEVGENNKITVKTNPYALTVTVTDPDFKGKGTSSDVTLVGSASADIFDISANEYIAVSGGTGDDVVLLGSTAKSGVSIGGGAGNDSIQGTGKDDLIVLGEAGNDTINITGNAQNVNGGAGDDNISVEKAVHVLGDAGNDTINVTGTVSNSISGGIGNDSVKVASAGAIEIKGDAGNDYIEITGKADGTKIYGGANDDTIKAVDTGNTAVSVVGDAGADVITFKGAGTIYGGAGNDSIDVTDGTVSYFYASGDGNDSVTGWNADDKFVLNKGLIAPGKASISSDGNDLVLTIGSGKVTLFGAGTGKKADEEWTYYSGTDTTTEKISLVGGAAETGDIASDINSLIYEDNNLVTPNDISDLVSTNSITEYHVGNYDLTTPDQILPDSDNISYGNQQKKNNK